MRKIFGRDPALIAALIEGLVLAAATFLTHWDAGTVGTVQAAVTLGLSVYVWWGVVDKVTVVVIQLGKTTLVLLTTFGADLSVDDQAVLLGLLYAIVAAFARTQVTAIVPGPSLASD